MTKTSVGDRLAAVVPAGSAAAIATAFWGFSYDDAYITYRYAANWAAGLGLTYNPGETVLGTTAPGYALLLGVLQRLTSWAGMDAPRWGTLLSVAGILATVLVAGLVLRDAGWRRGERLGCVLLFAATALSLRWTIEMLGSEVLPVMGLASIAAWSAFRGREVLAGLLLAAAMAARLDAAIAAAAIAGVNAVRARRPPWRLLAATALPTAIWLGYLLATFGAIVPNTLAGKRSELALAQFGHLAGEWRWLVRSLPGPATAVLLALALAGAIAAGRPGLARHPVALALVLWAAAHEVAYHLLGVPFAPWYHEYTLHAVLFSAALGAAALGGRLARLAVRPAAGRSREGIEAATVGLLAAVLLLAPVLWPGGRYVATQWGRPPDPRVRIYGEIGERLRRTATEGDAVASVEIGVLGYVSGLRVVDLMGLVSPDLLRARLAGALPERVAAEAPEYLVDAPPLRQEVLAPVLERLGRGATYEPIGEVRTGEYTAGPMRLLRRSPPDGPAERPQAGEGGPGSPDPGDGASR